MIVDDFDFVGIAVSPNEADAPPAVDPDAVLALAVSGELLEAVAWGEPEILESLSVVEHAEPAVSQLLNVGREAGRALAGEDASSFAVPDRLDHAGSI